MANIVKFEDFEAWKQARMLVSKIYELTRDAKFSRDFGLTGQLQRAAVSVMSNIAEGFERNTNREFIQFLYIAKGSAGEVRSLLYASCDLSYISHDKCGELQTLTVDIARKLSSMIKYLDSVQKTSKP